MSEVLYLWADPQQPSQQVALSSIVRALEKEKDFAIARWVSRDNMDPRMGVLAPCQFEEVDCLLWVQVHYFLTPLFILLIIWAWVDAVCG
jgi:ATP-dependent DNA helicase 2 subunit 2